MARDRKRWSKRRDARVTGPQLERYRADPHWERVQRDDFVVCRECGALLEKLYAHIPDIHEITTKEYRRGWPGAPLASANELEQSRERSKKKRDVLIAAAGVDPEAKKALEAERAAKAEYGREYRGSHKEELKRPGKRAEINRKRGERRAANPLTTEARAKENARQRARHAANREEDNRKQREAREADPERFKRYAKASYDRNREKRLEDARQRRAAAWRPADWNEWPVDWRIVANELLLDDRISNKELGRRLDSSRLLTCPYGETWAASTGTKACSEFIRKIRVRLGKPGRNAKIA